MMNSFASTSGLTGLRSASALAAAALIAATINILPAQAKSSEPNPAEAAAVIGRLMEGRSASVSTLGRAASEAHASLVRALHLAVGAREQRLGRDPVTDAETIPALLLELQMLEFAYDALKEELAGEPGALDELAGIAKVLALGWQLETGGANRGRGDVGLLKRIENEIDKFLGIFQREPARAASIVRNPAPEMRRDPLPVGQMLEVRTFSPIEVTVPLTEAAGTIVTPDITALAAELNFDPLEIYLHVRNTYRFETYFGCLKGAQAALETGGGNDYDLAALTASLLQASGFNTRFGRGTAIIPAQAMVDWLGLEDAAAANFILNTAGITAIPVVSGPDIIHYLVDRFWVEVEASLRPGDAPEWFPLDTGFKLHDLSPGVPGMLSSVPFDEATYLSVLRTELTWEFYHQQIRDWLPANLPGTTVDRIALGMHVIPETLGSLPRSLPYRLSSLDAIYTAIPTTLTHKATVRLMYLGGTEFSHQIILPDSALQRVTVSYRVDPADQAVVDGFGGLANTPAGAVDVIPELKLDGVVVASGGLIPYLDPVTIETDFFKPEGNLFDGTSVHTVRAGEWAAIGIDAFQISLVHLQRQVATIIDATALQDSGGTPDPDDLIGAFLYLAIMQYHRDVREGDGVVNDLTHFREVVQVSEGAALANQEIFSLGGVPFTTLPGNLVVDVPRLNRSSFALDDDNTLRPDIQRINGFNGSAQEHALWEGYLNVPGVSTIKSLQLADQAGIPVFVIDDGDADPLNDCAVLCPLLTLDPSTEAIIASDVASGRRVTVPRDPTPLNDWNGVGYITEDLVGGTVGYIISGGLSSAADSASSGSVPDSVSSGGAITIILADGTVLVIPVGQIGDAAGTANTGDPVNIANGNFFREEVDFAIPALFEPQRFERVYNSQSTLDGPLGLGWAHNYGDQLFVQPDDSVIWIDGRGTAFTFQPDPGTPGAFIPPAGLRENLVDTGSDFTMTRYDGRVMVFDANGLLLSRADRNGTTYTFGYDLSDRLETITDPASRSLTITYTTASKIATVADFTGRMWIYAYDAADRLKQVTSPSDAQTPAMVTQYGYTAGGLLDSITEPSGGVRSIRFYANGRVARVVDPLGNAMTLVYNPFKSETSVTNERGLTEVHEYNGSGSRISLRHADGTVERWTWLDNRMTSYTDGIGNVEIFEHDPSGNLIRRVDGSGLETLFQYDPVFGNVTRMESPGSRISTYVYDLSGNVEQFNDAAGGMRTMVNNAQGLPVSLTDPRGNTVSRTYSVAGQVATITTQLPSTETRIYDPRGTLQELIDTNTHSTLHDYDLLDRLVMTTDAEMNVTRISYDAAGRKIEEINPRNATNTFEYDLLDRLVRRTDASGNVTTFEYDGVGNLTAETDRLGRTTRFAYDARNRKTESRYPDASVARVVYDPAGRIVSSFDPLGNETRYTYDGAGRLLQITNAQGVTLTNTYDENGNVETITDRLGGVSTYIFDALNRMTKLIGDGGRVETVDFDENGNVIERARYDVSGIATPEDPRTLPAARTRKITMTYDIVDREETTADAEGNLTTRVYDKAGNLVMVTDARSELTEVHYDKINRVTRVIRSDTGAVEFTYDGAGNRTGLVTPEGGNYQWIYDLLDRIHLITDPDGLQTRNEYDPEGNLLRQLWDDGAWRVMTYNPVNRRSSLRRSDGTFTTWRHDVAGNILRTTTEKTELDFSYDSLNRRTSETLTIKGAGFSKTVSYGYDADDNVVQITDPTGRIVTYSRELPARLTGLSDNTGGPTATVGYNGFGDRGSLLYGNGTSGTMSHDKNARVTQIDWTASISLFDYTRDPIGNPTLVGESVGGLPESISISYDGLSRPTTAVATNNPGTRSETFDYDLNGNLPQPGDGTTMAFDAADQPVSKGATTYLHDLRGNRVVANLPGNQRLETPHDVTDRITAIREFTGDTLTRNVEFTYDGLNRMVEIRDGASVKRIVYSFLNRLVEFDDAGTPVVLYSTGPALDDVFGAVVGGSIRYLHRDDVGSIRGITDNAGILIGARHYGQFGRIVSETGITDVPLGFTGRPFDAPTGLVDLRARFYDPSTARFLARDPFGLTPSMPNLYAYAANRPGVFFDPLGLVPQSFWDQFTEGRWLGTGYGEEALQWWAEQSINPDNNWFENAFYTTGGLFAALWTPDTWWKTGGTLAGGWIVAPYAANAGTAYTFFGRLGPSWHFGIEAAGNLNVIHIGRHTVFGIHAAFGAVAPYAANLHIYIQRAFPFFRIWKP